MNVSFYWQLVIKGAVIILAVMCDFAAIKTKRNGLRFPRVHGK